MKRYSRISPFLISNLALGLLAWATIGNGSGAFAQTEKSLGGYPLCEASAAVPLACPESNKTCLLVGDNEIRDRVFLFEIEDTVLGNRRELYLLPDENGESRKVSDIESIAKLPSDEVVVYGSHSRNKRCKLRGKRRQFLHGLVEYGALENGSVAPVKSKKHTCKRLFGNNDDNETIRAVCEAISEAEDRAEAIADNPGDRETACNNAKAFNAEGAVSTQDESGHVFVWIGLRAPLVNNKAVMLRQKRDRDEFEFSRAVLLDLDGLGIRELAVANDSIWIIGGTASDSDNDHKLFRFNATLLEGQEEIDPELIALLPAGAEGLAISGNSAFVLMDGNEPDPSRDGLSCAMDSRYIVLDLTR